MKNMKTRLDNPMRNIPKLKATPRDVVVLLMFVFVILLVSASSNWCINNNGNNSGEARAHANAYHQEDSFRLTENQQGKKEKADVADMSNTFKDKVKKVIEKQSASDLTTAFRKVKTIVTEKQMGSSPARLNRFVSTFIPPSRIHHEKMNGQEEGDGSVFEGWQGGHQIKDGLAEQVWQQNKDWENKKNEVKTAMNEICRMFNELLTSKVFQDLKRDFVSENSFKVIDKSTGRCVSLQKWISFVNASIAAQMGYSKGAKTTLAKYVPLGFDALDTVVKELPALLTDEDTCPIYTKDANLIKDDQGKTLSYTVIWPADGSVLIDYKLHTN